MTSQRDLDRVLGAFLADGTDELADRVIEAALDEIDHTTQRRVLRVPWRFPTMRMPNRLAAAAVIGVIAVGGGLLLLAKAQSQVGAPSPSTTESPGSTLQPFRSTGPESAALALALQSQWTAVGGRTQPPAIGPYDNAVMVIGPTGLRIWGFKGDPESAWSVSASDSLLAVRMVTTQRLLTSEHWDCHPGQEGTYNVALAPGGATLSLTPRGDACAARSAFLAGDWTRTSCATADARCQELAAGRHQSIAPLPGDNPSAPIIGSYSYDVPVGWSNQALGDGTLFRRADNTQINIRFDLTPRSQAAGCPDIAAAGQGTGANAVAAWLQGFPGLTTTTPTPVTIGGYPGLMLDVSFDPTSKGSCRDSGLAPAIFTYQHLANGPTSVLPTFYGPDYRSRYVILDLPGGHNLMIEVTTQDQASLDAFLPAVMPIVDSFQFNPRAP